MPLPKSLTTVTTYSKLLALWLFLFLPFAGFYLGIRYEEKNNPKSIPQLPSSLLNKEYIENMSFPTLTKPLLDGYGYTSFKKPNESLLTYKNNLYTFQYPSDFTIEQPYPYPNITLKKEELLKNQINESQSFSVEISVQPMPMTNNSLNYFFVTQFLFPFVTMGDYTKKAIDNVASYTVLDGEKAIFVEIPGDGTLHHAIISLHKKRPYVIKINGWPAITGASEAYRTITSTFKFLDPNEEIKDTPLNSPTISVLPSPSTNKEICTMEAKMCPDGSFVGRTGPNCEFGPCKKMEP